MGSGTRPSFGTIEGRRWEQLKRMGLSVPAKLVLVEFLVGRYRNGAGAVYLPVFIANIANAASISEEETRNALAELGKVGLMAVDSNNDVLACQEFWHHSWLSNGKHALKVARIVEDLPENTAMAPLIRILEQEEERVRTQRPAREVEGGRMVDPSGWYRTVIEALYSRSAPQNQSHTSIGNKYPSPRSLRAELGLTLEDERGAKQAV